jgi:RNA polymerase sigma-70 factor (ECF subfamily)
VPSEPSESSAGAAAAIGAELAAQTPRLRLLLAHQAGRAVRARVELEDLVQEVLLRAWTAREALPAEAAALRRFLARLARNVVVDAARALRAAKRDGGAVQRLERSAWSSARLEPAARTAGPATRAVRGEDAARMLAAFEALAPEHRRVIGLRQLEGLSARETARRMGRSEAAVHSLFRRALAEWERGAGIFAGFRGDPGPRSRPDLP